jgi:hypothetical protein
VSRGPILPESYSALADFRRGKTDIEFYAKRWLGVRLNPGQVEWLSACLVRAANGYSPEFITTVTSAGNKAGKTLGLAVLTSQHANYKLGIRPFAPGDLEDARRWRVARWVWYHVGIQQEIANIVHRELSVLFAGEHQAQEGRGCPLTRECGPIVSTAIKDMGEYPTVQFHAIAGGAQIIFRSAQEQAKALLGKDMHGISFDEAAFEPHLQEVYQEVLHMRRATTGGPLHFIGTPKTGIGDYYDLWQKGDPTNPNRDPKFFSFRLSTRTNVGFGITQAQLDDMISQMDPYLVPQNIDGEFIEAHEAYFYAPAVEAMFIGAKPCEAHAEGLDPECKACQQPLPAEQRPVEAHKYSQGVDPGIAADASWAIILDYTKRGAIVGVHVNRSIGKQTIPGIVNMVQAGHQLFSTRATCATTLDTTGMGGKMWMQEFKDGIPGIKSFDFAGAASKKAKLLSDLKTVIDNGTLKLPKEGRFWQELRRQLLSYRLDDRKITQDAVMALAIAVYHAVRNSGEVTAPAEFKFFGGQHGSIR